MGGWFGLSKDARCSVKHDKVKREVTEDNDISCRYGAGSLFCISNGFPFLSELQGIAIEVGLRVDGRHSASILAVEESDPDSDLACV